MIVILALSIASADLQCELVVVDVENVMELHGARLVRFEARQRSGVGVSLECVIELIFCFFLVFNVQKLV